MDENGNEIKKEIIQEGEVFGQLTLEQDNLNGEFARAYKGDVSLCEFKIEDFENVFKKKPEVAIKYSKLLGNKLRHAEFRLLSLLNKNVRSRLPGFFYHFALQNGYDGKSESFSTDNFLTDDNIARLIGSAQQTVTTELSELEKERLVSFSEKRLYCQMLKRFKKELLSHERQSLFQLMIIL